jgi:phage tail-like protein
MSRAADPYLNVHFRVSTGEQPLLDCAECTGLSLEVATEEYHEGGQNAFSYKLPVAASVPNLVLKRGITSDAALWEWFAKYVDAGEIELRDGQVELLAIEDDAEKTVRAWKFTGAYPAKWTGPELNSMSAGVAFETVELVHRGIRLVES